MNKKQISDKLYRENNRERIAARKKEWYESNKQRVSSMKKERYAENKDSVLARQKEWRINNTEKLKITRAMNAEKRRLSWMLWKERNIDHLKEYYRNRRLNNPDYFRLHNAARGARVKRQLPLWTDIGRLMMVYENCPPGHHVDHIIPLKGIDPITKQHIVCGLHCPENLQYLPAAENGAKWAWFTPN